MKEAVFDFVIHAAIITVRELSVLNNDFHNCTSIGSGEDTDYSIMSYIVVPLCLSAGKLSSLAQYRLSDWDINCLTWSGFERPFRAWEVLFLVASLGCRDCLLYSIISLFSNKYCWYSTKGRNGNGKVLLFIWKSRLFYYIIPIHYGSYA